MTSPCAEIRRCRPLLGTFVEIGAQAASAPRASAALEAGFAAIARVQRLMSFHEDASDVSRLNRDALRRPVAVDPWTWRVLSAARAFHEASHGVFDVTVAPHLQRWGYLPGARDAAGASAPETDQSAVELLPGCRVRFRRPVRIDLGGIAKGFAVDVAIEALRHEGASAGAVNAGGDLRVFGPRASWIHVRDPRDPRRLLPLAQLADAALATSASYFARRWWRGRRVSPLVDPSRGRPCTGAQSVSVRAATCLVADALTKVVMVLGARSASILRAHAAAGFVLTSEGRLIASEAAA
jgi:thiamine biosynthesis lipoprotein